MNNVEVIQQLRRADKHGDPDPRKAVDYELLTFDALSLYHKTRQLPSIINGRDKSAEKSRLDLKAHD